MKILMLVPFLPNTQTSGGQTRWYNIVKFLSQEHDITLFSLIKDESEKRFIPELEKYCKKVRVFMRPKSPWTLRNLFLTIFGFYPLLVIRNWSPKERKAVAEELESEKYDLIHAETFYVMPHIPKTNVPSIMVEQTIEYQVYKHYVDNEIAPIFRPFFMIDVLKLRFWETFFWKKTTLAVAVSEDDKKVMQELVPGLDVDVIPNGVDTGFYREKKVDKLTPPRVMYGVTNYEWLQNREAAELLVREVWPKIHAKLKDVKLWIVGRMIPENIMKLADAREDIEVSESIPEARDAYQGATIMVAPIRGSGGTRLKALEAMAAGLPIVSTSMGVSGLGVANGKEVIINDQMEGLAEDTVRLLKNPKLLQKIGKAGQKFVVEKYDWKAIVALHEGIYRKAITKNEKN